MAVEPQRCGPVDRVVCVAQSPPVPVVAAALLTLGRYLAVHGATTARPPWPVVLGDRAAHDLAGYPFPTRDEQVRTVLAGIRRTHTVRPARV